ncbi:serine-threonine protein kinase, putative [Entamoeba invadens IP1]|uniref:serine-threonine protein kinase, putative n=1 Tax=Entamoeba invadens IP1 TaxID=370355 RepID=UPI0002C3CFBC|nr:serine-threonine protein kinase, putative [Entamoeba invadens IP1]ELP94021.1 serine-threonine protein kinase, putative [Entamoeba invadens IP1]|eukprot:XP_004260792.1 serine-threonine protein kinase, putative [Entamoeba invadens IP1]
MFQMILLCFSLVFGGSSDVPCSIGCTTKCTSNYTCLGNCGDGYINDNACLTCKWVNPLHETKTVYVSTDTGCVKSDNFATATGWISNNIQKLNFDEEISFVLNADSEVDSSPCYSTSKYRFGKWFELDMSTFGAEMNFHLSVTKSVITSSVNIDITSSNSNDYSPSCLGHTKVNSTTESGILNMIISNIFDDTDDKKVRIFINLDGSVGTQIKLSAHAFSNPQGTLFYNFSQEDADRLSADLSDSISVYFPMETDALYNSVLCMPNRIMKTMLFTMNFTGDYSIRVDSIADDRIIYLQNYQVTQVDGVYKAKCNEMWIGEKYGHAHEENTHGIEVKVAGDVNARRSFSIVTADHFRGITLTFRAICPNDCGLKEKRGTCSTSAATCVCADQYGGDECHLKCYYNNTWTTPDNSNLCYYGAPHCDSNCICDAGYSLVDHYCISAECLSGSMRSDEQCLAGSEGCQSNCMCRSDFTANNNKCKYSLCGNQQLDSDVVDLGNGKTYQEYCDSGLYCDDNCQCPENYITNPADKTSCIAKGLGTTGLTLIIVGVFLFVVICVGIILVVLLFVVKYKKTDINIYKTQQPVYYNYISGSTNKGPDDDAKYYIDPINLDFGNNTVATAINETRFERIEVKNCSKKKNMMIIFHTPNNPKYIFHFEPQVMFLSPHTGMKLETIYMTIHCTTKIREMKIPYTVWFSESKHTLNQIANTLKDKTFETWGHDDQISLENYIKDVKLRYHHYLTLTTDAASSTYLDMDELNMSDVPIAEGAMGKLYIGRYRSVPVAVKQFRWENLSDDEMAELKKEVINECEIMGKLRNPFIANYMGSVTYIPQVSMVIQFFVLGALGEYLRQDKEDYLKLPYKLKVRMLFDSARGMQFLHENKMMHLDLKPDNLLVNSLYADSACCIKITDFGTSRFVKKTMKNNEDKGLGTPVYAAPETYNDVYTYAGDVFSFAITAWELFYQEEPYKSFKSLFEIKEFVLSGKRLPIDDVMPSTYRSLLESCWEKDPETRPNFDTVCKMIVKIDDQSPSNVELDADVNSEKIEEVINRRNDRVARQMRDLSNE